jgi:hypothetical protein
MGFNSGLKVLNTVCGAVRHIHRLTRSGLHSSSLCPSRHEEKTVFVTVTTTSDLQSVSHLGHSDKKPRVEKVRVQRTARYTDILTQTAALYRHSYRQVSAGITYRQTVPYSLAFGRIYLSCSNSISIASRWV